MRNLLNIRAPRWLAALAALPLTMLAVAVLAALPLRAAAEARPVTIFAAASLRGALEEALAGSAVPLRISYGGSAAQARQIARGAPGDLVFLAHPQWMDWLEAQGAIDPASRRAPLGGRLVLIAPAGAPPLPPGPPGPPTAATLLERLGQGRLAIGDTRAVPAGQYARTWAEGAGLWKALEPRLAQTDNVRAALALVALGEAPLGVTFASDAMAEPRVQVLYEVPEAAHEPIRYPLALTLAGAQHPGARAVHAHLLGAEAARAFARAGFQPRPAP